MSTAVPSPAAAPTHVWSDLYGAVHARYAGRPGGHAWLVAAEPEQAAAAAEALSELLSGAGERLKGSLELLVYESLLPLGAALRGGPLSGVVVVGAPLSAGPSVQLPEQALWTESGLSYREGGQLPAWRADLDLPGIRYVGEQPAASLCAAAGVPVLVCAPARLGEALLSWAALRPHGLA